MRPVYLTDQNDSGPKLNREIKPGNPPADKTGGELDEMELPANGPSTQSG